MGKHDKSNTLSGAMVAESRLEHYDIHLARSIESDIRK